MELLRSRLKAGAGLDGCLMGCPLPCRSPSGMCLLRAVRTAGRHRRRPFLRVWGGTGGKTLHQARATAGAECDRSL